MSIVTRAGFLQLGTEARGFYSWVRLAASAGIREVTQEEPQRYGTGVRSIVFVAGDAEGYQSAYTVEQLLDALGADREPTVREREAPHFEPKVGGWGTEKVTPA